LVGWWVSTLVASFLTCADKPKQATAPKSLIKAAALVRFAQLQANRFNPEPRVASDLLQPTAMDGDIVRWPSAPDLLRCLLQAAFGRLQPLTRQLDTSWI